jgi:hypothetical protein
MPMKRENLERQSTIAQENLAACVAKLKESGVDAKAYRKNPIWRNLDATCRQLKTRLFSVKSTEDREAECAVRKASSGDT